MNPLLYRNPSRLSDSAFLGRAHQRCLTPLPPNERYPILKALEVAAWKGDASLLPPQLVEAHYILGVGHVLALSGQHVIVLCWLFGWFLTLFAKGNRWVWEHLRYFQREMPWCCGLLLVVTSGGTPSAIRSFSTLAAIRWLRYLGIYSSPLQLVFSSIALCLCIDPTLFRSIGFLLSAFSVVALVYVTQLHVGVKKQILFVLAVPILLLPVQAFYFGKIPLLSIPASLVLSWVWDLVWIPVGFLVPILRVFLSTQALTFLEKSFLLFSNFCENNAQHLRKSYLSMIRPTWWESGLVILTLIFCIRCWVSNNSKIAFLRRERRQY